MGAYQVRTHITVQQCKLTFVSLGSRSNREEPVSAGFANKRPQHRRHFTCTPSPLTVLRASSPPLLSSHRPYVRAQCGDSGRRRVHGLRETAAQSTAEDSDSRRRHDKSRRRHGDSRQTAQQRTPRGDGEYRRSHGLFKVGPSRAAVVVIPWCNVASPVFDELPPPVQRAAAGDYAIQSPSLSPCRMHERTKAEWLSIY
jgi:hypothetical protein